MLSKTHAPTGDSQESHADVVGEMPDTATQISGNGQSHAAEPVDTSAVNPKRRMDWARVCAFVVLPVLALLLTAAAGFLKWQDSTIRSSEAARIEAVQVAKDTTVALLSYQPDTVEQELRSAAGRLTGSFQKDYQDLADKVVIPGSKEQHITTTASVPAAAAISASASRTRSPAHGPPASASGWRRHRRRSPPSPPRGRGRRPA